MRLGHRSSLCTRFRHGSAILIALAFLAACGDQGTTAPTAPVVASIALSTTTVALTAIGQTSSVTATAKDQSGTALSGVALAWASSNVAVATVSQAGAITAVSQGASTVSVSNGTASATVSVTVTQVPATLEVSRATLSFESVGATATLTATVKDAGGTAISAASVNWSTSNESVARVANGVVTAVSQGTATITASSGSARATTAVTITLTSEPPAPQLLVVLRHADDYNDSADWDRNPPAYLLPNGETITIPWIRLNPDGLARARLIGEHFEDWLTAGTGMGGAPLGHVITRDPRPLDNSTTNPFSTIWPTIDRAVNPYVTALPVGVRWFTDVQALIGDVKARGSQALFPASGHSTLVCMTWQSMWGFDNNGVDTFDPGLFLGSVAPDPAFMRDLGKPTKAERVYVFSEFNDATKRFAHVRIFEIRSDGALDLIHTR